MHHFNSESISGCPIQLCAANHRQLGRLADFLERIDVQAYSHGDQLGGSIGGHVRHIIEHYDRLFRGSLDGRVDYSARTRDQALEVDPRLALCRIESLRDGLRPDRFAMPLTRTLMLNSEPVPSAADSAQILSTMGRELMFMASHTVHHMAVIALLARARGTEVEAEFGVADSTLLSRAGEAARAG